MKPPDNKWVWGEVAPYWWDHAMRYAGALQQELQGHDPLLDRHAWTEDYSGESVSHAVGVVGALLFAGIRVPLVATLMKKGPELVVGDRRYKVKSAHDLSESKYGFIAPTREQRTLWADVTHLLLVYVWEEHRRVALVGEVEKERGIELQQPGWWMPTPNPVIPYTLFQPVPWPTVDLPFTYCPHGSPVGDRCFSCEPLRTDLFPPREKRHGHSR